MSGAQAARLRIRRGWARGGPPRRRSRPRPVLACSDRLRPLGVIAVLRILRACSRRHVAVARACAKATKMHGTRRRRRRLPPEGGIFVTALGVAGPPKWGAARLASASYEAVG